MKPFFMAFAYSWRAGLTHKAFANCGHRHRTHIAAFRCAYKQPRYVAGKSRRWATGEIVMAERTPRKPASGKGERR